MMKIFEYTYYIRYGNGCGIVIAETKEEAVKIIQTKYKVGDNSDLEVIEIDISQSQIIDHSDWG